MEVINKEAVQAQLDTFKGKTVYIHLETTNGAYASHFNDSVNVGAYIRNARVAVEEITIKGDIGYRVGIKTDLGWVYAEGLTDWELFADDKLLMAGHDPEGRVMVALQISETPFE